MKKMKNSVFNFIWNKRERISRDTVIGKQRNSGLGLVDIELKLKAIKASWVKRLTEKYNVINNIVNSYWNVMKLDLNYLLTLSETKTENFTLISKLPIFFYREIYNYFNECKKAIDVSNLSDVKFARQPLWNKNLF